MKPITKDTKISDLIPDGYEFDNANSAEVYSEEGGGALMVSIFRKKKQKSFDYYTADYLIGFCNKHSMHTSDYYLRLGVNNLPFEIKIGLLKFICEDIGYSFYHVIRSIYHKNWSSDNGDNARIFEICPISFLKSIL